MGQSRAKAPHEHEDWQLEENDRGVYCKACGEYTSYKRPEHEKLIARKAEHEAIEGFLQWMDSRGMDVVRFVPNTNRFTTYYSRDLITDFFEIDEKAFEKERRVMLEELRRQSE